MIHRIPHQEHSRPRSRTSSGNYNTKQQLHQDDPLPSPSKSSVHHNNASAAAKSQSSSSSLKRLTAFIGIGLLLLFCSFLLWNLNGLNSHELLKFSIHDSYSSHTSHYGQRGRRSRGGAGNGEGGSDNSVNHFTSKYVEILTRNWLLQQFKYLRRDFLPQPSYTSSPSSPITVKTKTEQAAKEAGLSLLIQPNTFVNLTSPYNPFDQRLSQGVNLWDLFPPVMNCPDLQRIGKVGEGGKWVCGLSYLQSSFGPDEPCVIYSFGVNDDISFEIELLLKTDCEIFAFDPTIGQLPIHNHLKAGSSDIVRGVQPGEEMSVTELKQRLHFEKIALSDVTGSNEQFLWSETLYDIMQRHRHSFIHLLKVDIESSEWRIFSSLFSRTKQGDVSGLPVGEILIELHYEALPTTVDFFSGLYSRHFYSVSREINLIPTLNAQKPFAAEYTFVNVNNFYGVHPPLPLSTSRLNEGENEVTSLRSHSRSNVTVPRTPVKALIYFLTQRKRLPRMCDAVQRLFENFLQHYPHYPVVIFHDDLTAADEDFLQRRCLSTAPHPPSPSDPPKREEVSVTLRFVRIDFKTPKHLTKRNVFIPTRTFCDPSHSSLGYRHMCRFHAYGVHRDLARVAKEVFRSRGKEDDVDNYYIWRLDDDSQLTAPIGYDIFRFMAMNEKLYGFISMLKDDEKCVMGLWETSRRFFNSLNSSNSNHAFNYSDSLLPQWPNPVVIYNNFEISHSSVWRHPVWLKYRDYLDWLGGIYTLRWGDAPIHTIIVTTILDRRQIHKFSDIGYSHLPFLSQKAKGLPMPGMDPFLLLPVTCTYFQEWNCVISAESNTSSNFSFSSTAQRDDFLVSVSLVKKASSRQHQTTTDNNPNTLPLPMPSIPTIPNKERGVIFSFGEIEREDVLVQTIKNFYVQFARQFSIPFVVFYDQLSSFNESKILSALMPLMQQSNDPLYFHLLPVVLPNLTSPGADVRIEKNDKCWMNRHDKELSISLFLQRQAFDLLSGMGYQWFFRIPDHARLLMPVTYNPFGRLEAAGKKYGFMQTTSFEVSLQPCLQSLMSFVDELCGDIDDLSRQVSSSYLGGGWEGMGDAVIPALPRCSSFYSSDWDRKSLFVTGMAISHVSLWQSLFASFFFDVTHPRQSEDKALTLSEELLSSLSSSATSSKKKKRVTPSASSYQSLLTLLERMKSAHNRTIRSTVMNWGDHVIHNLILLTSTSTTEVEKLPHFYVTIGLDERSSAVQAPPAGSMKGGAGSVIESRQAQHIRSDVVPLNRIFSPQSFGWLGGDVAVSIPYPNLAETHAQILPPRRLLWLFGDTFLGMTSANRRVQEHSQMIDNSVAITTLSELDKDDVACEEREKTPLRHLLHHQYYHRLFNHDEEAEKRGSGIFLLPPQSAKDFCNVESEKASVWPIGGLFAFDSTRRLQLLVLADVSCQRRKDSSTTSSTSSAQQRLFGVETLNFHTKQQLLYRVKNPLDTPDLWSYDVVPINLNAPPSSSRTSGVVTDYAWVALAEGKGKYYADADDFLYILASAEIRGKGDETRQQHHGFFRVRAKDLLALTRAKDLTSPTSSLEILGRGGDGWQKFRPATEVIEIADLFAPVEHLFPHYRMNEASLFYDVSRNEWVLYHVNSLTLHTSYLYCSLPAKEVETRGAGFRCQYLADIEKKWLHPSVITYAGRLHPHLLHPSLNHLQMAEVVRGKVCDGKRRVMTSQVSNTATSLDLLFRDFDEKAATSENRNRKQERDVPTSSEIYVPRFVYIREI